MGSRTIQRIELLPNGMIRLWFYNWFSKSKPIKTIKISQIDYNINNENYFTFKIKGSKFWFIADKKKGV